MNRETSSSSPNSAAARTERAAAERTLLAALCQGTVDGETRQGLVDRLEKHAFAEPEHEAIFRALRKLPAGISREQRKQLLPAILTRLGFPDTDIEAFFQMEAPSGEEAARLMDML